MESAKEISKKLTFLPKHCIGLKLKQYVSTYAGPLKFSKPAQDVRYDSRIPKIFCMKSYIDTKGYMAHLEVIITII